MSANTPTYDPLVADKGWRDSPLLQPRERPWQRNQQVGSWLWVALSVLTLGIVNPGVFLYAAIKRRTRWWWLTFLGFTAVVTVVFILVDAPEDSIADDLGSGLALVNWVAGAATTLATRRSVFQPRGRLALGNEPGLAAAVRARERRELARQILATDPDLARDLQIGRAELKRKYNDGGLVDVNSVPETVLAAVPGLNAETAAHIVAVRAQVGRFSSIEDLGVTADIAPDRLDTASEWLVVLT